MGPRIRAGDLKNQWAPNLEEAPRIESMGGTYAHKRLNENLQPLVRFLRSRVGRPWDEVRSEIAAQISCKSAVQKHVLDHLRDYVVQNVRIVGSTVEPIQYRWPGRVESVGMRFSFYVDPDTRALRLAPPAPRKRRAKEEVDPDRRVLSRERELRRIEGIWYRIDVAPIPRDPSARAACFDVVERAALDGRAYDGKSTRTCSGGPGATLPGNASSVRARSHVAVSGGRNDPRRWAHRIVASPASWVEGGHATASRDRAASSASGLSDCPTFIPAKGTRSARRFSRTASFIRTS